MLSRALPVLWLLYFGTGIVLQGYFAETALLTLNLILYAAVSVVLLVRRELAFSMSHLVLLLLTAAYWAAVPLGADREQAVLEAARVSGLLPLSLLFSMIPAGRLGRLYGMWPWIGALVAAAGTALGMERNGRLEATLDYANALAIFLLVNVVVCVLAMAGQRRFPHAALLAVNAAGLLLTFSRSVWVLWLIAVCAAFVWIKELRRPAAAIAVGAAHLCGLALALLVKGDALFFVQRVSSIQARASELQIRLVYWRDSLAMIRDHWLTGSGGGGWSVLLDRYRSADYYVRFVHNHYLQTALDAGAAALLALAAWLALFYWTAWRRLRTEHGGDALLTKGVVLLVTVMALHAGFDIDLTFPVLFGVLASLVVPMSPVRYKFRLSGRTAGLLVPAGAAAVLLWFWLAVAYASLQAANEHARAGRHPEAQVLFHRTERMIPWQTSAYYGEAKSLIRQGNETGDAAYYRSAADRLERAIERVPQQTLYTGLLDQLKVPPSNSDHSTN